MSFDESPIVSTAGEGLRRFMIVCSCHVFGDHDVRNAVGSAEQLPRNAKQLYAAPNCGRWARTIQSIIDEALGACARAAVPDVRTAAQQPTPTSTTAVRSMRNCLDSSLKGLLLSVL
jgi:bacterioferritin-associated ferredoxin